MNIMKCTSKKCSSECKYRLKWKNRRGTYSEKHFKLKADAKAFMFEVQKELEQGVLSSKAIQELTLNDFMKNVPISKGNETTEHRNRKLYENHLKEKLGRYKLRDITRVDCQDFFDKDMMGYSYSTMKKVKDILVSIFDYASADGYIVRNPAKKVLLNAPQREEEPTPLTPEQIDEFIQIWDEDEHLKEYSNFVVGLAYLGCRPQELIAVTWDDVDLDSRTIDINKSVRVDKTGKQYTTHLMKTEHSSRVLAIDEVLLARLRFRKTTHPSDKYVFSSSLGEQINLGNFRRRYFKKALLQTSLPIDRPYDLRHTFCALMWSRGVKIDRLSRMMGHKNVSTTQNWYGNWYREADFSGVATPDGWKKKEA